MQGEPAESLRDKSNASGGWLPPLTCDVRHLVMQNHTMIMPAVLAILLVGCARDSVIIGKLGKPVGTELTIEGAFQGEHHVLVARVNGEKLATPVLVAASNLSPPRYGIPTNTLCRFRGKEVVLEMGGVPIDQDTGAPLPQSSASVPRYFSFEVTEVIAPKEMKTAARVIMTSGFKKMGGGKAQLEILQHSATHFTLRLEIDAFGDPSTFPREVKAEAYSRGNNHIPLKFGGSMSTSWATNTTFGFYELNLEPGTKVGYVILTWKNESKKFVLADVAPTSKQR